MKRPTLGPEPVPDRYRPFESSGSGGSVSWSLEQHPIALDRWVFSFGAGCESLGGFRQKSRMPSALSVALRERVVAAVEEGASRRRAAKRFGVSPASAVRWCGNFVQEGRIAPKPMGGLVAPALLDGATNGDRFRA